jgi:hypothetical protein
MTTRQRGRKRTNDLYFGPDEESAVVRFLECNDDKERNAIYNQWLRAPFDKMIESIIRRYKLYRKGFSFEDLHTDTLSFLITKANKFEKYSGKRAYSYYGTICKHYILGLLIKDDSNLKQLYSYEELSQSYFDEREDLQYELNDETDYEFSLDKFILKLTSSIKAEITNNDTLPLRKRLSDNEVKVGYALIDILENWEETLDIVNGGSKFNKNSVLETMRNYTNLSTKDIRASMKRYKEVYTLLKIDGIENGFD